MIALFALPSITVESAGWGVAGFLFLVLSAGVGAVWRTIDAGNWVRKEEHERLSTHAEKVEKKLEKAEEKLDQQQETIWRLSQTNTVAVRKAVGAGEDAAS